MKFNELEPERHQRTFYGVVYGGLTKEDFKSIRESTHEAIDRLSAFCDHLEDVSHYPSNQAFGQIFLSKERFEYTEDSLIHHYIFEIDIWEEELPFTKEIIQGSWLLSYKLIAIEPPVEEVFIKSL